MDYTEFLSKKLQNRGTGVRKEAPRIPVSECKEPVPSIVRKKGKKRPKLTNQDKIAIIHKVLIEHVPALEIAKEYRISYAYVSLLASKAKKTPDFLREVISVEEEKNSTKCRVVDFIDKLNDQNEDLMTVDDIQKRIK